MATNDTIVEGMAGRYASALFDLAKEASKINEVEADLTKFQGLLDESDDLRRMVRSPVITTDDQARRMGAILAKAGIGGLAANFFKLIAEQPPLVRGRRHDQGLPRARRQGARRSRQPK